MTAAKGGRPSRSEQERRSCYATVRMTIDERLQLEKIAAANGLSVSDFLRKSALQGRVVTVKKAGFDPADYAVLSKIGANLNQIAKRMNGGLPVENRALAFALEDFRKLAEAIKAKLP